MEDTCFVIFGLLEDIYVDQLINCYADIKDKIISTWKDQDPTLLKILNMQ